MESIIGQVLYYGLKDEAEEGRLLAVLADFALASRKVEENQLDQTVASLLSQVAVAPQGKLEAKQAPAGSILLLHQLADTMIRDLLAQVRQAGLVIDLKAVVTEHNFNWTFAELATELQREDVFMRQMAALDRMIVQAESLLEQDSDMEQLAEAVVKAKAQLAVARSGKGFKQEEFLKAGRRLAALLRDK